MEMKLDYSDIVSKLAILLGSGMTTHQAWNIISARYIDERQRKNSEKTVERIMPDTPINCTSKTLSTTLTTIHTYGLSLSSHQIPAASLYTTGIFLI